MSAFFMESLYFGVVVSVFGYWAGCWLKKRWAAVNPLLFSVLFVILVLIVFQVDYSAYQEGAQYLSYLLTPATICLAIPLYRQFELLKKNWKAILFGTLCGMLSSMLSIYLLSLIFGLTHEQYVTLLPKSITTAIGLDVSLELGGISTLTIASIILTGIFGNLVAGGMLKLLRIRHPVAKGVAIGCAAHAIGTAKAMEMGEVEGAMSSLALAVSGLMTVIGASFFAQML